MDWVTIGTYGSIVEAELVKERLRTEGIHAMIADAAASGVMPYLAGASGVRVQVESHNAERARTVLAESTS